MNKEAVEAVIDLIEIGAVVGNADIVKCLRSALDTPQPKQEQGESVEDKGPIIGTKTWFDGREVIVKTIYFNDIYKDNK